jgi:4-amino-4-deoxy-L-arabinose transferase-like glycosyltransferase
MSSFQPARRRIFAVCTLGAASLILLAALYTFGALRQMTEVNVSPGFIDQDAYMSYAQKLRESGYTYIGDHNRMPVYPWLQSWFYRPYMHRKLFFLEGKARNLLLSYFLLAGIAAIFWRKFHWQQALNATLIAAFTVFLFKAGWFQTELLFYFLNFVLFVALWRLLQCPGWAPALGAGALAGLAHLTKASVLPALALFLGIAALQAAWLRRANTALSVLLVAAAFLAVVFPYIQNSKRAFGHYFYNVNSTFYIWYDSWEEAAHGTKAHGDREHWPDMPAEEIPSPAKYLREHTPAQVAQRFFNGAGMVWEGMSSSFGYLKYVLFYAGVFAALAFWQRERALALIRRQPFITLFTLVYFAVYGALYAWYAYITPDNRLILAQFLPLMFALYAGLQRLGEDVSLPMPAARRVDLLNTANWLVLIVLMADMVVILTTRAGSVMGGR